MSGACVHVGVGTPPNTRHALSPVQPSPHNTHAPTLMCPQAALCFYHSPHNAPAVAAFLAQHSALAGLLADPALAATPAASATPPAATAPAGGDASTAAAAAAAAAAASLHAQAQAALQQQALASGALTLALSQALLGSVAAGAARPSALRPAVRAPLAPAFKLGVVAQLCAARHRGSGRALGLALAALRDLAARHALAGGYALPPPPPLGGLAAGGIPAGALQQQLRAPSSSPSGGVPGAGSSAGQFGSSGGAAAAGGSSGGSLPLAGLGPADPRNPLAVPTAADLAWAARLIMAAALHRPAGEHTALALAAALAALPAALRAGTGTWLAAGPGGAPEVSSAGVWSGWAVPACAPCHLIPSPSPPIVPDHPHPIMGRSPFANPLRCLF